MSSLQSNAIALAIKMHEGQKRKTGEPYVNHCLRVMKTIEQYTDDDEILASAVLHDIFEDTEITIPNLAEQFSPRVSFIVNSLSKNKKPENSPDYDPTYRLKMYLNRFAKGCIAEHWIMFIKMADQIDNSSSFHIFPLKKQERKRNEIIDSFAPIYSKISQSLSKEHFKIYTELLHKIEKNIDASFS